MDDNTVKWLYIVNMIAGTFATGIFVIYLQIRKLNDFTVLPKSLRLFVLTNVLPAAIITALASIIFSIHFLIYFDENSLIFKGLRFIVAAAAQHVRGTLLLMVLERIVSTIYFEKYGKLSSKYIVFIILTFAATSSTTLYIFPTVMWIFIPSWLSVYYYLVYLVFFIHIITLIVTKILYDRNKRMYVILAYQINLNKRYQIVENIKVLTFLRPAVLTFALIAPWGLFAALIHNLVTGEVAPTCLFLITYNLSFFLIIFHHVKERWGKKNLNKIGISTTTINVISPLGNALPTTMNSGVYFKSLKKQWG